MADDGTGEKTEEPTPKKIEDARKKGQVWKSRDLTSTAVFLTGVALIAITIPASYQRLQALFVDSFARAQLPIHGPVDVSSFLYPGLAVVAFLTLPIIVGAALVGGFADFVQVGAVFTQDPLKPQLERLNPIKGLRNLFSKRQAVELVKATVKLLVAAYLAYRVTRGEVRLMIRSAGATPAQIAAVAGYLVWEVTKVTALLLVAVSIFDVWWQRRVYHRELMMTKDEVKREYRESEGDPTHRAKRRELHQEILESAMLEDVRKADVIITNPDHIAVALKYKKDEDQAPRVVAKGVNVRAEQIKAIAEEEGIPVMRNVALAQALNRLEIGDEIPEELYDAVAEILNFVYSLAKEEAK